MELGIFSPDAGKTAGAPLKLRLPAGVQMLVAIGHLSVMAPMTCHIASSRSGPDRVPTHFSPAELATRNCIHGLSLIVATVGQPMEVSLTLHRLVMMIRGRLFEPRQMQWFLPHKFK